jgi:hypothetical protein
MPADAVPTLSVDDRLALHDLMARFATGIDTCDWAMYRSVFADEIDLDYSSWRAGSVGRWSADDWVARAGRLFPGLTATRHGLTNLVLTPEPGGVRARVNVCADHVVVDGDRTGHDGVHVFTLNGYYDDRCVRLDGRWLIEGKRLVVQWTTGDRALLDHAADLVAKGRSRR